ncbi:hypothetical protein EV424DRAFT_1342085 [Suillus variegatus]|nr:hypothetical protein EV424DRAFT_1342085 [Suillus variegatus]
MNQYAFPSSHSPYSTHQTVAYPTSPHSQHGHGSYNYGTPLRRASTGHAYAPSPQYGHRRLLNTCLCLTLTTAAGVRAGTVIADPEPTATVITGMGTGTGTDTVQLLPTQSHTQHLLPYTANLARDIIALIPRHTDTVRTRALLILQVTQAVVIITEVDQYQSVTAFGNFLGMEPSSNSYYNSYGNRGQGHHNSYGGMRDERRPRKHSGYVDEHGREVDSRGRMIHRY